MNGATVKLLYFITGNLLIFLLLFTVYLFPKNLLEQAKFFDRTREDNLTDKMAEEKNRARVKVKYYFYAFDYVLFSTVIYSWVGLFVGIILFTENEFWIKAALLFTSVGYLIWTIILWFFSQERKREGWKSDRYRYIFPLNLLASSYLFLVAFVCSTYLDVEAILFWMAIIMLTHLFVWLIPHVDYKPISWLLKLGSPQNVKGETRIEETNRNRELSEDV